MEPAEFFGDKATQCRALAHRFDAWAFAVDAGHAAALKIDPDGTMRWGDRGLSK